MIDDIFTIWYNTIGGDIILFLFAFFIMLGFFYAFIKNWL